MRAPTCAKDVGTHLADVAVAFDNLIRPHDHIETQDVAVEFNRLVQIWNREADVSECAWIGCSGSSTMWVYPHLLEQMRRAPDLVIRLTAAPQVSVVASVLTGDIDLGVVAEKANHPRLHATPFFHEEICLIVPSKLASDTRNFQRLDELDFVAHPDGFAYADVLFLLNFPDDFKGADHPKIRTSINKIGQIPIPAAQGLGYTILPKSGVEAFPNQQDISIVQLPERKYHALWMISHKGRTAAVKRLVERATKSLTYDSEPKPQCLETHKTPSKIRQNVN